MAINGDITVRYHSVANKYCIFTSSSSTERSPSAEVMTDEAIRTVQLDFLPKKASNGLVP